MMAMDSVPIEEIYEKFKHFDALFCDPLVTDRDTLPESAQYEMWVAIKKSLGK